MAKVKNLSGITGEEYKSIIDNVNEIGSAYNRTNNAIKDFIESNKKYKDIMSELAKLETEVYNARKNGGDVDKAIKELNKAQKKYSKELQEIYKETKRITEEVQKQADIDRIKLDLQQNINENLELEHRHWQKLKELRDLEIKQIREGLTIHEKISKELTKWGEQHNINTDKFKKGISEIKSGFGELKSGLGTIKTGAEKINEAWGKVDQAASDFTKRIGGSAASMEKLRKTTIDFMETRSIGVKYNTSMEELIKLQGDYNASIGRSIDLTNDQKETFAAMKSVVGEQAAMDFSVKLENFGLNPEEVGDRVGEMFSKAAKSGIAFEKYSKNFLDNIKLAQNYNFQNGLKGLDAMAKKATAIRLDMQQVARFADKVSTLEGAVQAGAQLSVLGGSFAQMGNPLSMLYEGLNDMEGLQDRMVNMFGKMGKWDYSKGQVDVSVFNKQRIKAAAEATGMDYSSIMEMINASARRNIVQGKIGTRYDNDEDFKELILNKAQLDKEGNAFVTINGEKKNVTELTKADEKALKSSNRSDSDKLEEIAVNTRGYKDIKEGFDKQKDVGAAQVNEMLGIGETTKSVLSSLGENSILMRTLGAVSPLLMMIQGTVTSILGVVSMGHGMGNVGRSFGNGGKMPGAYGSGPVKGIPKGAYNANGTWYKANGTAYSTSWQNRLNKASGAASATGRGTASVGNTVGTGVKGMSATAKIGAGLGLGAAGMIGDAVIDNTIGQDKGNNVGWYTAGKATTGALQGAAMGAMFGLPGIAIGAGLGAAYGGITGHIEAKKENIANQLRSSYNATINDPNSYSINELEMMKTGTASLPIPLKQKMSANGDNLGGYVNGGYTGDGNPLEPAGTVHKGEIVIPSTAVKASGNLMNSITVSTNKQAENQIVTNPTSSEVKINPIEIRLSGNLTVNGEKVDTQKLMDAITPRIIDQINDQLMSRNNFRLDRNKVHKKFAY